MEGEHLEGENVEELMVVTAGAAGSRMQQKVYEVVRDPLTKTGFVRVLK